MKLKQLFSLGLWLTALLVVPSNAWGHINPERANQNNTGNDTQVDFRSNCDNAVAQIEQEINNVRARLTTGGDVWWDSDEGRYVVPKPPPGENEVSSIFAGAVWLGGRDISGELKVAAQQYGRSSGNFDYYPGPLTPAGFTSRDTCARWDRFFVVDGQDIRDFVTLYETALENNTLPLDIEDIPESILGWPSKGNPYFFDINGFDLPNTSQGLAGFWDQPPFDGIYDPTNGEYPIIEIRGCSETPQFAEQMHFWIYNDAGNIHRESNTPTQIRMEVQVQAFAYSTSDEINNMTFQRYKLINRAPEDILETYFAMWVDPDLGCYTDDYVGCDTVRSLAYVYNEDELDGTNGTVCDQGVNTYGDEVPILGVDYFRGPLGPLDTDFDGVFDTIVELGMSSFIYVNNSAPGNPAPGTQDPGNREEYYNYLQGIWRDGSPLEIGGDGYDEGTTPTRYALPDPPNNANGWSMCTADLGLGDRRTIQASGPFTLQPGAVNELIVGVVWVADQIYPCPSLQRLQQADDIAQSLFDNCFDILDGPDAPDVDWIELDREIIALLSNNPGSNNVDEAYQEAGLGIPTGRDSLYRFQGYRIFQFSGPDVSLADIDDPEKVRIVAEVDLVDGVQTIFNWRGLNPEDPEFPIPTEDIYFIPELQVSGTDNGIKHSFRITEDRFADDDTRLINHRRYYFTAIAYAYNNYKQFDPEDRVDPGQPRAYLPSGRLVGDYEAGFPFYTVIPRPILDRELMAEYGDAPQITRLAGKGNNGNFLDISEESMAEIEAAYRGGGTYNGEITYNAGAGPIDIAVVNPLDIVDGRYEVTFEDENNGDDEYSGDVTWTLRNLDNASAPVVVSERPISELNEQIVPEYGFAVTIGDRDEPGSNPTGPNGAIGGSLTYEDPDGSFWLSFVPDNFNLGSGFAAFDNNGFDYVDTEFTDLFESLDQAQSLTNMFPGAAPYKLMNWADKEGVPFYLSPVWRNSFNNIPNRNMELADLNNVDIVFTSDKELWSRCPVIEARNDDYPLPPAVHPDFATDGEPIMFDTRSAPSVTRDAGPDGLPTVDTNIDPALGRGMGWFPGYAVDVETGERLGIFFAENSVYDGRQLSPEYSLPANGGDMMWNPSDVFFEPIPNVPLSPLNIAVGAQHFVYVTKRPYDAGEYFEGRFMPTSSPAPTRKSNGIRDITWALFPFLTPGENMLSYADGLIPNKATLKLRVDSEYDYAPGVEQYNGHGAYQFEISGKMANQLNEVTTQLALDMINVVPNPYYGTSIYEDNVFENIVKVTNLPAKCKVSIYSLDGKFIRQYNRDEQPTMLRNSNVRPIGTRQITPALEWDLNNFRGIPVASGVYLIHVDANESGLGERTLKLFLIHRQFDPTGL